MHAWAVDAEESRSQGSVLLREAAQVDLEPVCTAVRRSRRRRPEDARPRGYKEAQSPITNLTIR